VSLLNREALSSVFEQMDASGLSFASDRENDHVNPLVARLEALGIQHVRRAEHPTQVQAMVYVWCAGGAGWGWDGQGVDDWLAGFLDGSVGSSKVAKLSRAGTNERHLAIVLDGSTEAGIGIPLGLLARDELDQAYAFPSLVPPEPLTHLWLIPESTTGEGLTWSRTAGWTVLDAYSHDRFRTA
jgi:hypothetical protein